MDKVTVEVNAPDVINITSDAGDNITLSSTAMIVLPGASGDTSNLISSDPNNALELGGDNKLFVDISDVQSDVAANTQAIEQLQAAPSVDLAPLDARVTMLESDITAINQAQAAQDTAISAKAAQLSLDATNKTIADNYTALNSAIAQKTSINDAVSSAVDTWSSTKISNEIVKAFQAVIGGAGVDSDTLKELADKIAALAQADNGLLSLVVAQAFTIAQQAQGRANLGLGALATQNTVSIAQGGTGVTTLAAAQEALGINDNKVLNPIKIGAKWYQAGLYHGADYPKPYNPTTMTALNQYQFWVPFIALEDAVINSLAIQCTGASAGSTVSLGIYASDSNNDLANAIFTSSPIDCAITGLKSAPCNVTITKGNVYWLSSLTIGTPQFYRNYSDDLQQIKGGAVAGQANVIGYAAANMTTMPVTPPSNKVDRNNAVPRVAFTVL